MFDVAAKLIQTAIDTYGKIDILINVAALFVVGLTPQLSKGLQLWYDIAYHLPFTEDSG